MLSVTGGRGDDLVGDDLVAAALARPRVRVNQVGYLPAGPKRATVITQVRAPLPFLVRADDGGVRAAGRTVPWPDADRSSGLDLHVADFSGLDAGPGRVRLEVAEPGGTLVSHWFRVADDVHATLPGDALRFFYAQRSGVEISDDVLPGYARPAGHLDVPPNRGDRAVRGWRGPDADRLYPGWRLDRPVDVSGGWYDAGDHGKYVVSGALPASMLLDVGEHGGLGAGRGPSIEEEAGWQVDWLLRMQVPDGEQHAGMAFHRVHDAYWTPLPLLPHDDPAPRVLHRPSTAATLHLAAVAAQASRRCGDPARRDRLLTAARTAWAAAERGPTLLAPADDGAFGGGPYDDAGLDDDRYWAAAELYLATGEALFLAALAASPCHHGAVFPTDGFGWDVLAPWTRLRLARAGRGRPGRTLPDAQRLRGELLAAADRLAALGSAQPWGQPYDPDGGWDWGSTGALLSNLMVLATAHELAGQRRHRDALLAGLDFLLGRNAVGLSFVTGHGTDCAHHQRVRHFGRALDVRFPPPPPGSLAGGPASRTFPGFPGDPRFEGLPPQFCYVDEATSETTNDVCIRWNAPLVWIAAFLARTA